MFFILYTKTQFIKILHGIDLKLWF